MKRYCCAGIMLLSFMLTPANLAQAQQSGSVSRCIKVTKETKAFCSCYKRKMRRLNSVQRDMAYDMLTGRSLRTAFRYARKLTSKQIDQVEKVAIPAISSCLL